MIECSREPRRLRGYAASASRSGAGAVHDGAERLLHHPAGAEDQLAAVLELIDRVAVAEPAAGLLVKVEPEAQARRVDSGVNDLAQAPCRPGLGQGVCDVSQALWLFDPREAVGPPFVKDRPAD